MIPFSGKLIRLSAEWPTPIKIRVNNEWRRCRVLCSPVNERTGNEPYSPNSFIWGLPTNLLTTNLPLDLFQTALLISKGSLYEIIGWIALKKQPMRCPKEQEWMVKASTSLPCCSDRSKALPPSLPLHPPPFSYRITKKRLFSGIVLALRSPPGNIFESSLLSTY